MDGSRSYRIHFAKDGMPPVKAFWSITMYGLDGFFVENPINRFAIGDRDALKFNADGSLDIYISHEEKANNWLPAPAGAFNLSLRLYWPSDAILSGKWAPPALVRRKRIAWWGGSACGGGWGRTIIARLVLWRFPPILG